MDLWIRVDASSSRDPRIAAFGRFLGISTENPSACALGHLVMVWSAMAEHAPDGRLTSDALDVLEDWAGWRGTPGRFREGFVEFFVTDGEVRGYAERQGKLLDIRARDRARKRAATSVESPRKLHGTAAEIPALRDETRQDKRTTSASRDAEGASAARRRVPHRTVPAGSSAPTEDGAARGAVLRAVAAVHEREAGAFPWGRAGKQLKPVFGREPAMVAEHYAQYLLEVPAQYRSFAKFAEQIDAYAPKPIMDQWGQLTEFGERLTRPTSANGSHP